MELKLDYFKFGDNNPFVLIAGPCVIESEDHVLLMAKELKEITSRLNIPFIFKASYDKANRSSIDAYRGLGVERGLEILNEVKSKLNIPVLSDVHCVSEIKSASEVLDIIQIPAFLSRQTDLLVEAGKTQKIINVKKGQFLSPWDIKNVINKIESSGNNNIMITERGASFGYNNLVSDMRSLIIIRKFGYPVVFDATHSVQLPGGLGSSSDGQREFAFPLMRAATAVGVDGLFIEVHDNPSIAKCDGPNMLVLDELEEKLKSVKQLDGIIKNG